MSKWQEITVETTEKRLMKLWPTCLRGRSGWSGDRRSKSDSPLSGGKTMESMNSLRIDRSGGIVIKGCLWMRD